MNTKPLPAFIANPRMPSAWTERSDYEDAIEAQRRVVKAQTGRKPPKARNVKASTSKPRKTIPRPPKDEPELYRWHRLGILSNDPRTNDALLDAGVRLRDAWRRGEDITDIVWSCGSTWPAVSGLAIDGLDKLEIGQRYERDVRAAKAAGQHMAIAGLEILARGYGLIDRSK